MGVCGFKTAGKGHDRAPLPRRPCRLGKQCQANFRLCTQGLLRATLYTLGLLGGGTTVRDGGSGRVLAVTVLARVAGLVAKVLQHYLDHMGNAVMQERFDDYSAGILLPLSILTSAASITVATVEELQDGYDDFIDMIQSRGITEMVRTVIEAREDGPHGIVGVYSTRLEQAGQLVVPEFYSRMWLRRIDGVWKAEKIHNTTLDPRWPLLLNRVPPLPEPPEELMQ